jgi:hypothetical protein
MARMKIPPDLGRAGGDGTHGCRFFLVGGAAEELRHRLRSLVVLVLSPGESLDSELDRRDSGVLGVVPLLGVSHLETRLEVLGCAPPVLAAGQGYSSGALWTP